MVVEKKRKKKATHRTEPKFNKHTAVGGNDYPYAVYHSNLVNARLGRGSHVGTVQVKAPGEVTNRKPGRRPDLPPCTYINPYSVISNYKLHTQPIQFSLIMTDLRDLLMLSGLSQKPTYFLLGRT